MILFPCASQSNPFDTQAMAERMHWRIVRYYIISKSLPQPINVVALASSCTLQHHTPQTNGDSIAAAAIPLSPIRMLLHWSTFTTTNNHAVPGSDEKSRGSSTPRSTLSSVIFCWIWKRLCVIEHLSDQMDVNQNYYGPSTIPSTSFITISWVGGFTA